MKIAVTGANGFVGAALCRYFRAAGHRITAIGRQSFPPGGLPDAITYISADITRELPLLDADVCIHAAALASDTAAYPDLYASNVTGTAQVLRAATHCSHFIQVSSSSVYAFANHAMQEHEASLTAKLSDYGKTKLLAEQLVADRIPEGQKRLVLRPRAIYGTGDRVLLPRLLRLVKRNTLYCPVPANIQTSLTDVENIGYAIALFLQKQAQPAFQVFNIADENVYNLRETLLRLILEVYPHSLKKVYIPKAVLQFLVTLNQVVPFHASLNPFAANMLTQSAILDLGLIREQLGYAPSRTFDAALPEIGAWIGRLGGVERYLRNAAYAPWLVPYK